MSKLIIAFKRKEDIEVQSLIFLFPNGNGYYVSNLSDIERISVSKYDISYYEYDDTFKQRIEEKYFLNKTWELRIYLKHACNIFILNNEDVANEIMEKIVAAIKSNSTIELPNIDNIVGFKTFTYRT